MWWVSILQTFLGIGVAEIKSARARKYVRETIRNRILVPVLHQQEDPKVRRATAEAIVHAVYGISSLNLLGAMTLWLLSNTVLAQKIQLIDRNFLKEWADEFKTEIEIVEDDEDLRFEVKKGRRALDRLIKDMVNVL
jgi:hypothetical protein